MLLFIIGSISGLLLGLTGGGGAIVTVPLLIYFSQSSLYNATTLSLIVVAVSSLLGVILKRRDIRYIDGFIFAGISSLIAPMGVRLSKLIEERLLILAFGLLMIAVAIVMIKKSLKSNADTVSYKSNSLGLFLVFIVAAITGLMTGMFGVGGGFIIVPALNIFLKMNNKNAVATSLFIITIISFFTLSGKIFTIDINPINLYQFMFGGIVGMVFGILIAKNISSKISIRIFGVVAFLIGIYMLIDVLNKFDIRI